MAGAVIAIKKGGLMKTIKLILAGLLYAAAEIGQLVLTKI